MDKHVTSIGVLFIAFGAQGVFMSLVALAFIVAAPRLDDETANSIITGIGIGLAVPMLVMESLKVIGGIGLLRRWRWSRMLVLVLAFPSLIFFPIGTGYGIYAICILLKDDAVRLFATTADDE